MEQFFICCFYFVRHLMNAVRGGEIFEEKDPHGAISFIVPDAQQQHLVVQLMASYKDNGVMV